MNRLSPFRLLPAVVAVGMLSAAGAILPPQSVRAQDDDNATIAAAKKATLIVEGKGAAPIKPTSFYLSVEVWSDGKADDLTHLRQENAARVQAMQEILQRQEQPGQTIAFANQSTMSYKQTQGFSAASGTPVPMTFYREIGVAQNQVAEGSLQFNDPVRVTGRFSFGIPSAAAAQLMFAAMRSQSVPGQVTLGASLQGKDEAGAQIAALKAATANGVAQMNVLSVAAKPNVFDLAFVKQGEFQAPSQTSITLLVGKGVLPIPETLDAETTVTLFYGLKAAEGAANISTAKTASKAATKITPKPAPTATKSGTKTN